ncbi:MAG: hypothetical protein JJE45_00510 [Prolixibacteraceae bacterium]|nr:hypothetical protein [Prolixibacteraceae bacterium]
MLNQGVTYYYRVRAYNAAGISGYSNVITLGITGHWILADEILDTFDAYSPDNFAIGVSIGTDINAVNEAGGWHILSHPSWVDVTVWNPITSRVADPPYYQGLQIKVDTNSTNTGAYRSGNIVLTDDSGNVLATIAVSQYGGPPTAYCVAFGSWTLLTSSAVVSAGSPILNLSYSVDNFSDITQNMWISVFRNGIEVAYVPKATRNYPPYTQTMNITMNENAIGGGVYAVVISSIEGHTLP